MTTKLTKADIKSSLLNQKKIVDASSKQNKDIDEQNTDAHWDSILLNINKKKCATGEYYGQLFTFISEWVII